MQLQSKFSLMKTKAIQTSFVLDLCPPASPVLNTFWFQCRECVMRVRRHAGLRLLFRWCRVCGESSLSAEGLHVLVDLQLSRTTCHCLQASSFTNVFLTAFRGFWGMTKRPLKCLAQQQGSGNLLIFATALLVPSMDHSFTIVCIFSTNFSSFFAAMEVAEQPPNKRRRNSSFFGNIWKLTLSFWCLSYLLQPKAQQMTVFNVAVQLGWPVDLVDARFPLDCRAVQKPWNCQDNTLAGRHGEFITDPLARGSPRQQAHQLRAARQAPTVHWPSSTKIQNNLKAEARPQKIWEARESNSRTEADQHVQCTWE